MNSNNDAQILNEISFSLLKTFDQNEVICFSPLSILATFNALLQFTPSNSLVQEIGDLFKFDCSWNELSQFEKVNWVTNFINKILIDDSSVLKLKYGVWVSRDKQLRFDFVNSDIKFCQSNESVGIINEEILQMTDEKIKDFLNNKHKPQTGLVSFSVLHLKGHFLHLFKTSSVADFHLDASNCKKVTMMTSFGMFKYVEDKEINAKIMNHYLSDGSLSLLVIVPIKRFGLTEIVKNLTVDKYRSMIDGMKLVVGSLSIPAFSMNCSADYLKHFQKCNANKLSTISSSKAKNEIDHVDHFIQGTAIAVNDFGVNLSISEKRPFEVSGPCMGGFTTPPERQEILADEPFLIILTNHKENYIISMIRVTEPDFI